MTNKTNDLKNTLFEMAGSTELVQKLDNIPSDVSLRYKREVASGIATFEFFPEKDIIRIEIKPAGSDLLPLGIKLPGSDLLVLGITIMFYENSSFIIKSKGSENPSPNRTTINFDEFIQLLEKHSVLWEFLLVYREAMGSSIFEVSKAAGIQIADDSTSNE